MVSAVVHTYNEEENIDRCLSSLSWTDEIVLVDMGSTDKTIDKARQFKAKIFQHPYTGFVEPARNFGIEKARGDWIVILDADEEVPFSLSSCLLKVRKEGKCDFVRIPRKNIIFGKWIKYAGWWPDHQVRFFKRGYVSWVEKIHGIPATRGQGLDLPENEDLSIIHYHYLTISQYIERLNRYTTINAKELYFDNLEFDHKFLFKKPVAEFVRRFFLFKGYKEGLHGLALSFLQAISEAVTYLKLWELEEFKTKKLTLEEVEQLLSEEAKEKKYWVVNELLEKEDSSFKKIILRLKRRIMALF